MKKYLLVAIISLFVLSIGVSIASENRGSIAVSTSANAEIAPDTVEISFAVLTSDLKSMQKATEDNKAISDRVYAKLKSLIDTSKGDYIKTVDYNAAPVYSYQNSKKNFERYEVTNRVIVHTKSLDKIGSMIDSAIKEGATNVDNLSFSLSNYETQCNDLLALATQKAKSRAEAIAKSIKLNVIGVNNITTSCSTNNYNPPRLYMAKNMIADVAAESTTDMGATISKGVVKVNASVNASFFVQ